MNIDTWSDSAFPSDKEQHKTFNEGLTKREHLFASVMTGLTANPRYVDFSPAILVALAHKYVDAACQ